MLVGMGGRSKRFELVTISVVPSRQTLIEIRLATIAENVCTGSTARLDARLYPRPESGVEPKRSS
jgi:hypothetical protein